MRTSIQKCDSLEPLKASYVLRQWTLLMTACTKWALLGLQSWLFLSTHAV